MELFFQTSHRPSLKSVCTTIQCGEYREEEEEEEEVETRHRLGVALPHSLLVQQTLEGGGRRTVRRRRRCGYVQCTLFNFPHFFMYRKFCQVLIRLEMCICLNKVRDVQQFLAKFN